MKDYALALLIVYRKALTQSKNLRSRLCNMTIVLIQEFPSQGAFHFFAKMSLLYTGRFG